MTKRLIILGSTGSIGTKALEVVADFPDEFEIVALSTHSRAALLVEQMRRFGPKAICLRSTQDAAAVSAAAADLGARVHAGDAGLTELIDTYDADMVLIATVGFVGVLPTMHAIQRGMTVALANKEVLVTAGHLVMEAARSKGVCILPIDSEHNAVFQCLNGNGTASIRRIILTASGGPFRGLSRAAMHSLTKEDALRHPTWNMGPKITIDSATLMNKGFEVMEAAHLFGIPASSVDVLVHPQSTVHSMIEYVDGSIIAQMGATDMYLPIQNVLMYPDRKPNRFPSLDLARLGTLTFEEPDVENFPCLRYAYEAAARGGTYPAVLNASNEVAVARFLADEIPFLGIPETVEDALQAHQPRSADTLEEIQSADSWARQHATQRQFA